MSQSHTEPYGKTKKESFHSSEVTKIALLSFLFHEALTVLLTSFVILQQKARGCLHFFGFALVVSLSPLCLIAKERADSFLQKERIRGRHTRRHARKNILKREGGKEWARAYLLC